MRERIVAALASASARSSRAGVSAQRPERGGGDCRGAVANAVRCSAGGRGVSRGVLVTGAAGFVGGYLCAALGDLAVPSSADVTDAEALRAEVADAAPGAVVHLAAVSSTTDSLADPGAAWHVNAVGTVNLAEAVRHAAPGARLLVVSTGEVYGDTGDGPRRRGRIRSRRARRTPRRRPRPRSPPARRRARTGSMWSSRGRSRTPAPATTSASHCRRSRARSRSWSGPAVAS